MRKKQFYIFVLLSLFSWAVVTYFIFRHRPLGNKTDDRGGTNVMQHLTKLEQELNQQFSSNVHFLEKLRQIIKHRAELEDLEGIQKEELPAKPEVKDKNIFPDADDSVKDDEVPRIHPNEAVDPDVLPDEALKGKDLNSIELADVPVIAILVFACNRVTVRRCLDGLIRYRPSPDKFPIVVTQDCDHKATSDVIDSYGDQLTHIRQPDQSDIPVPTKEKKFKGYFKIARHYGWALNYTFYELGYDTVIIVEDDLEVSPDFFEYFLGTWKLLALDPTLWCVSAWNDNGKEALVDASSPHILHRTDFFPGLGWMLQKSLWAELAPKWPKSYWDDWVRQPEQRKNRACIRPEISRTRTFGKIGVSNGLFYEKHLKYIKLNEKFVPFTKMNLTYLMKDNYDVQFVKQVYESPVVTFQQLKSQSVSGTGPLRIPYNTKDAYKRTAKMLGLMDDFKSGVPRTGYRGVVSFSYKGRRVYLAPSANWKGYDPTWS
ncbi:alpha-1,3-mannosyl-glycoprotein 2-beta-N-acetylglucosaminyltransferase-like isoform X1 [Ischnura elegans]|uniref:alpha-1,3-mannosyl-glycoprotein 2-beta-N-acetylglucosaminyltransferase-like isoform X1 n=1 Tax=Ischnura elegans TaxID=197161 RepID=UPI001ED87D33|nr:alpha-1,3-mannosyl-glycoprotein 2-beta-N-acetylglucosaminyltransferase-like isoform X1 [Ischnura elegans]XP_046402952.1 alpha-1,3-mannosyl-glycoprotein 2-beta-N-acetylglucosaminyltransferase-like isoform X1 [Ischnura elegans]